MTKLLIIYGSEASGKLTIAKEVVALTQLRLFDNHISIDVGKVLFEYGDDRFSELVWKVRLAVFKSAAKHKLPGIVFTWAYSHPDMHPLLELLLNALEPYDVDIHYVHLQCSQAELERRVISEERKRADKAFTIEALHRIQHLKNHVQIPNSNSLVIDTTEIEPIEAANMIIDEFSLESAGT